MQLAAALACMLWLAPVLALGAPAAVKPDNKWRIVCNHRADADGVAVFRVTPEGGAPVEVRVEIKKGTGENAAARQIRDVFRATLSKELYYLETDDGEDVLVKKRSGKPNFALELVSNGVKGLSLKVKPD